MLKFFPTPYPDELLYSVLARYHIRRGNTSPKATVFELFGSKTASAVIDMPCGIDSLISNMPLGTAYTAEYLIENHTMYPYYTVFLPCERKDLIYSSMKSNFGGDIHTRSGIMASSIKAPEYLRFCPECNKEDLSTLGECYWHIMHQIPGVLLCHKHDILLQDSIISNIKSNKHEYMAANQENCNINYNTLNCSASDMTKLNELAKDTKWIFQNYKLIKEISDLDSRYVSVLQNKGLASPNGRVYQKDFIDSFIDYYGREFLLSVQSDVEYDFQNNWLSSIVRKHRKSFHPLRHILMMRYLAGSVEEFFKVNESYKPFGEGPWPCLNAASYHYLKAVIDKVTITQCIDTKLPVGTFNCSCGFTYSRRGPDKKIEDIYKIGRIKAFGPIWEKELKRLVEIEKLGIRATARKLNVDPNTVKKYASLLGINSVWVTMDQVPSHEFTEKASNAHENFEKKRDEKRFLWSKLMEENPTLPVTEIRKKAKAVHSWLYKNNQEWLQNNKPINKAKNHNNIRIDWDERDCVTLIDVKKAIVEMNTIHRKPERITVSTIGKKIEQLALLEKHLSKMSLTQKYVNSVVESVQDFQVRRIRWAAREFESNREELKRWKILRLAGIKPQDSMKFDDLINQILSKE
ncbi:TnsD family transposase [Anaerosolibacter sp.]|uniref:TnsD family transposase n=1 Tax=Anaerosolibacter sp. TaxID=1872527 RepID=UPI0039F05DF6